MHRSGIDAADVHDDRDQAEKQKDGNERSRPQVPPSDAHGGWVATTPMATRKIGMSMKLAARGRTGRPR